MAYRVSHLIDIPHTKTIDKCIDINFEPV
jgi:hypothetical protein